MRTKASTYRSDVMDDIVKQILISRPGLVLPARVQRYLSRRIREGRGQGIGPGYRPWLTVRDVPSRGYSTRVKGWKTQRVHHLLSRLERATYASLEWSSNVVDIREQYPLLPLELTLALAASCGIKHPTHPRTGDPVVMTTDFLATVWDGSRFREEAHAVKYAEDLKSRRTLQKLEIERRYWEWRNTDWGLITDAEISMTLADNVLFVHSFRDLRDRPGLSPEIVRRVKTTLTVGVLRGVGSLSNMALDCDARFSLEPGSSLSIAYHLIANRIWHIDMYQPIEAGKVLLLLNATNLKQQLQSGDERNIA